MVLIDILEVLLLHCMVVVFLALIFVADGTFPTHLFSMLAFVVDVIGMVVRDKK